MAFRLHRKMEGFTQSPAVLVTPRRGRWIRVLLHFSILATVVALAIKTYRGEASAINELLISDLGLAAQWAGRLERVALAIVLVVTAVSVFRPVLYWLLPAAVWVLAETICKTHLGVGVFYQIAPAASALRYCTPIGAALLLSSDGYRHPASRFSFRGAVLLRVATGFVFLAHGYEAWQHHPGFIELITKSVGRHLDVWPSSSQVTRALSLIGVVDILVGLWLLLGWSRYVLAWAAFWGFTTALSRMTALGWEAYPEVLYRSTHFAVPLALLLLIWKRNC